MTVPEINHFAVLGLKLGASEDDIRQAYKSLARKYHPDKNGGDKQAEEKFKQISSSYEFLQSKDRREIHERDLLNMNKKKAPKGNNVYFEERSEEPEKRRGPRKENRKKKADDKRSGFNASYNMEFPFGEFKSYNDEFHSFFSKRDPFGKDFDPKRYFDEFMKPFKFGAMGGEHFAPERLISDFMKPWRFGDIDTRKYFDEFMTPFPFEHFEKMFADFRPFEIDGRQKGRDIEPWAVRFNLPSPEFTSFYGGKDPFKNF